MGRHLQHLLLARVVLAVAVPVTVAVMPGLEVDPQPGTRSRWCGPC